MRFCYPKCYPNFKSLFIQFPNGIDGSVSTTTPEEQPQPPPSKIPLTATVTQTPREYCESAVCLNPLRAYPWRVCNPGFRGRN